MKIETDCPQFVIHYYRRDKPSFYCNCGDNCPNPFDANLPKRDRMITEYSIKIRPLDDGGFRAFVGINGVTVAAQGVSIQNAIRNAFDEFNIDIEAESPPQIRHPT